MADLQADILNEDFLRSFLPETIYLVPEEASLFSSDTPASTSVHVVAEPAPSLAPTLPAAKPNAPAATPVLPKLSEPVNTPKAFDIIGENHKGVAILVTLPGAEFKALPQLEFLQKIMNAIGLQAGDVAYVNNVSGQIAVFEQLQQELAVKYIISFASRINTNLPHDKFILYSPVKVADVPIVFSHDLKMIEQDVELKKKLWNALRQTFGV